MSAPVSPHRLDEQTPLLAASFSDAADTDDLKKPTPLPKGQIAILLLIQMAEPITSQSILPFINQLVSELGITGGDERKVGYYAGLIESLFFMAEATMVLQWSRLSDRVGRRPILMVGLLGLTISMLCFGLSKTFLTLVLSRAFAGGANGNIAIMKSMVAEISDETNIAQAFSLMPVVWATGSTVGPFIGGVFSRPHDRFPDAFKNKFWKLYPYFLPCAVAAGYCMMSLLTTAAFLKETLNKDLTSKTYSSDAGSNAANSGIADRPALECGDMQESRIQEKPVPLRGLFTLPVLLSVVNYGFLALLDIALAALLPLFYSTPIELGGLGLSPATIGLCMGAFGIMNGVFQGLYFSKIVRYLGPRRLFMIGMGSFIPLFALFPIINFLARRVGFSLPVWSVLAVQLAIMVVMDMSYGCIFLYITSASPNKRSLGATNGFAQTVISVVRTIGPAMSTSLFALTIERHMLWGYGVYIILILITLVSLLVATPLPHEVWGSQEKH
ncbi:hypothetical protein EW146_g1881 [Bondarzewia mesenterica]|uniref:Major facilitator superfamily (MFS) profile domain-containing protein n=1 Tax=Bondarzewia mesenterica TaxID=1095465 RepID=A0A4S4M2E3_9AGAM|nr:hypothetical protein EW146_g1881 [Bondarzewia mesenterica]